MQILVNSSRFYLYHVIRHNSNVCVKGFSFKSSFSFSTYGSPISFIELAVQKDLIRDIAQLLALSSKKNENAHFI